MPRVVPTAVAVLALLGTWCAPAAAGEVGWRGDGTGHFPGAQPPLHWGESKNVRWSTRLPAPTNASPIVVAGRVFTCAEPTWLFALDARDGRVLWMQRNEWIDSVPAAKRTEAEKALAETAKLAEQVQASTAKISELKRDARRGKAGALETIEALESELETQKQRLESRPELRPLPPLSFVGYSSPTPVSDGKRVFVLFGNGVVSAFSLKGKRLWSRWLGPPPESMHGYDFGTSASPRLAGGRLIVGYGKLRGLDPATGETLWEGGEFRDYGTPAVLRAAKREVVATAYGELRNAKSGAVIPGKIQPSIYNGPVALGSELWFAATAEYSVAQGGAFAMRYSLGAGGATQRFSRALGQERHYATPLVHEGLVYAVSSTGRLEVFDAESGERVFEQKLDFGSQNYYQSPLLAGGRIYLGNESGETLVLAPGRKPKELARNVMPPHTANAFFSGRRIYLRGQDRMWCLEAPK